MKNFTIAFLAAASLLSFGACKKKGDDVATALAKMEQFKTEMCKCTEKACGDKVKAEMDKVGEEMKKTASKDVKPTDEQTKQLMTLAMGIEECYQKVAAPAPAEGAAAPAEGAAAPAEGAAAPAAAGDLPAECNEYKAEVEKLATCDKLPQQTRDALKQSYEQTSAAWANTPAEGKAALATGCKSAADAVKQAAAACN